MSEYIHVKKFDKTIIINIIYINKLINIHYRYNAFYL